MRMQMCTENQTTADGTHWRPWRQMVFAISACVQEHSMYALYNAQLLVRARFVQKALHMLLDLTQVG